MENEIWFAKVNKNAVVPTKRDEDAGYDIYLCFDEPYKVLEPHQTATFPTGITTAFPEGYVGILKERGSSGTKGLGIRCGVGDSGFRGEWFVAVTNHNAKPVLIAKQEYMQKYFKQLTDFPFNHTVKPFIVYPYEKAIAQLLFVPIARLNAKETAVSEILAVKSERGAGMNGSTGK